MSRRDVFHDAVRRALEKEGWTITHAPLPLIYGTSTVSVDLGASAPLGAEREGHKIAVEIKSFLSLSGLQDLYGAVGQFIVYCMALRYQEPERTLYLAVPAQGFADMFDVREGLQLITEEKLKIAIYDAASEVITRWIE